MILCLRYYKPNHLGKRVADSPVKTNILAYYPASKHKKYDNSKIKEKDYQCKRKQRNLSSKRLPPPDHESSPLVCLFLVPYSTVNVAWHFPGAHLHFKQMEKHQYALNVCYHILGLWNVMTSSCSDDLFVFRGTVFHNSDALHCSPEGSRKNRRLCIV